jgi:hypothetical protein
MVGSNGLVTTPEVQQVFDVAMGIAFFSQHLPFGPWMPALTKVQARQLPSCWHVS